MKQITLFSLLVCLTVASKPKQDLSFINPIKDKYNPELRSGYGMRIHPVFRIKKLHSGVDFVADSLAEIRATESGTILETRDSTGGYGKSVIVQHNDTLNTRYAHLSKILVQEGQKVNKGKTIGIIGSSGASTARHLHYEVIINEEPVNPKQFLEIP